MNRLLAAVLVLGVAGGASAGEASGNHTGWYVGGALGAIDLDVDVGTGSALEGSSPVIEAFGGYNFFDMFGVELSYASSTDSNSKRDLSSGFGSLQLTPKLIIPIADRFRLYAKAGLAVSVYILEDESLPSFADETMDWSGTGGVVGLGAEFSVTDMVNNRAASDYSKVSMDPVDKTYYNGTTTVILDDIDVTSSQLTVGAYVQF